MDALIERFAREVEERALRTTGGDEARAAIAAQEARAQARGDYGESGFSVFARWWMTLARAHGFYAAWMAEGDHGMYPNELALFTEGAPPEQLADERRAVRADIARRRALDETVDPEEEDDLLHAAEVRALGLKPGDFVELYEQAPGVWFEVLDIFETIAIGVAGRHQGQRPRHAYLERVYPTVHRAGRPWREGEASLVCTRTGNYDPRKAAS